MILQAFTQNVTNHYAEAREAVRDFVSALPCNRMDSASPGFIASRTTDETVIQLPTVEDEPSSRTMSEDGDQGIYVHRATNGDSLAFKPSSFQFGGHPHRIHLDDDFVTIYVENIDRPPTAKERHRLIFQQFTVNLHSLVSELERENAKLLGTIETALAKRKAECAEIEKRRSEL